MTGQEKKVKEALDKVDSMEALFTSGLQACYNIRRVLEDVYPSAPKGGKRKQVLSANVLNSLTTSRMKTIIKNKAAK